MVRGEGSVARCSRPMIVGGAALLLVSGIVGCASVRSERAVGVKASPAPPSHLLRRVGTGMNEDDPESRPETSSIYLLLRLGERRLYMMQANGDGGTQGQIESFPVAIGRKGYETPTGSFQIREKIVNPDWVQFDWDDPSMKAIRRVGPGPDNPLGPRWIGFATSSYGLGIGFHGTPHPELIGHAVSHGCVRMRNSDVVRLYSRVRLGTRVIVEP
jgi:hypothetical protein